MKRLAWIVGGAAVLLACLGGWIASTAPDGLERVAQSLGFATRSTPVVTGSPLADYEARFVHERRAAQAAAGLVGVALLYGFGVLFGRALRRKRP